MEVPCFDVLGRGTGRGGLVSGPHLPAGGGPGRVPGEVWHSRRALLGRPDPWRHLCLATRGGVFLGSCWQGRVAGLRSCDTGS